MKLAKFMGSDGTAQVGIVEGHFLQPLSAAGGGAATLQEILENRSPSEAARARRNAADTAIPLEQARLLAPIDQQEVWAAGVTYKRSQTARMEESEAAASCYDRVYQSPRPELFFKATPHRVRGTGQALRIRRDAQWNVPEPELALVLNSRLELVGFTIGNDMSSRDIEGDNPLYLPQAKLYDECCGLGPWIVTADELPDHRSLGIELAIERNGQVVYQGSTSVSQMARSFEELMEWLGRDNSFPTGVFLLTGTGIVPEADFTLSPGDQVRITVAGIGTLSNSIVQG